MQHTTAQNAAEKDLSHDFRENPLYRTTKDIEFPQSSFSAVQFRLANDSADIERVHKLMKTQNFKVTA